MIAYISGPITGMPDDNREAFFEAERQLCQAGWYVFNPIRIDDECPVVHSKQCEEEEYRGYAERDLAVILKLMRAEDGDAIVLLPGWRNSPGSKAEWHVAMWVGMDVFYSVEEAVQWSPRNSLQATSAYSS